MIWRRKKRRQLFGALAARRAATYSPLRHRRPRSRSRARVPDDLAAAKHVAVRARAVVTKDRRGREQLVRSDARRVRCGRPSTSRDDLARTCRPDSDLLEDPMSIVSVDTDHNQLRPPLSPISTLRSKCVGLGRNPASSKVGGVPRPNAPSRPTTCPGRRVPTHDRPDV